MYIVYEKDFKDKIKSFSQTLNKTAERDRLSTCTSTHGCAHPQPEVRGEQPAEQQQQARVEEDRVVQVRV